MNGHTATQLRDPRCLRKAHDVESRTVQMTTLAWPLASVAHFDACATVLVWPTRQLASVAAELTTKARRPSAKQLVRAWLHVSRSAVLIRWRWRHKAHIKGGLCTQRSFNTAKHSYRTACRMPLAELLLQRHLPKAVGSGHIGRSRVEAM